MVALHLPIEDQRGGTYSLANEAPSTALSSELVTEIVHGPLASWDKWNTGLVAVDD